MVRRYWRLAYSREEPPKDEVAISVVVLIFTMQFAIRLLTSTTEYSLFWPHIPFGGILDALLGLCVVIVIGLLLALVAVRLYRGAKRVVIRIAR